MLAARESGTVPTNRLLLLEHSPVYTVGIRSSVYSDDEGIRLRELGAEFVRSDRGGLITFHGPGQLVAYPLLDLEQFSSVRQPKRSMGVRSYVCHLETTLTRLLQREYSLPAVTTENTGVWLPPDNRPGTKPYHNKWRKLAAIGVRVKSHITQHGCALNVDTDLKWYSHIVACGLEGMSVSSLAQELEGRPMGIDLDQPITVEHVMKPFCRSFEHTFRCQLVTDEE